ncbi:MAG TPA: hypothetical protein VK659_17900, partial [Asanoa sp.]|nr:hypothetical protein [Asanoa sp.]
NGQPAGATPGPSVPQGGDALVAVLVTNTGDAPISGLTGTTPAGAMTCVAATLAPGATTTCTIVRPDTPQGQSQLAMTFTATTGTNVALSDTATAFYQSAGTGGTDLGELSAATPTVNGTPAGTAPGPNVTTGGDAVIVVVVSNPGDAPINGLTAATPAGAMTCVATTLAPAASTTCTITGVAAQGQNTAPMTFTATTGTNVALSDTATAFYTGTGTGGTDLGELSAAAPTVNGTPAGTAPGPNVTTGGNAVIVVVVSNPGDAPISGLAGTTPAGALTCAATTLAPAATTTCTITGVAAQGQNTVAMTFTATTGNDVPLTDTTTANFTGQDTAPAPGVLNTGTPTVNGQPAGSAPGPTVPNGSNLTVAVPVSNTGGSPITSVSASTPAGTMTCGDTTLAPGSTTTCTGPAGTAQNGPQTFNLNVTGTTLGNPLTAPKPVFYTGQASGGNPVGELVAGTPTVNGSPAGTAPGPSMPTGSAVSISVPVSNTGDAPIANLAGTAPSGTVTCAAATLAPGASTTCMLAQTAAQGPNQVPISFTGTSAGTNLSDSVNAFFTGTGPGSDIGVLSAGIPTVNGVPSGAPPGTPVPTGGPVTIVVQITNTGTQPITGLTGNTLGGAMTCAQTTLAPGASTTCTVSGIASSGPRQVNMMFAGTSMGSAVQDGTAAFYTGTGPDGPGPGDGPGDMTVVVTINDQPAGTPPGPTVDEGDPIGVLATVSNPGGLPVEGITVQSNAGTFTCAATTLAPGESTGCSMNTVAAPGANTISGVMNATTDGDAIQTPFSGHYSGFRAVVPGGPTTLPGDGTGDGDGTGTTLPGDGTDGSGTTLPGGGPVPGDTGDKDDPAPPGAVPTGSAVPQGDDSNLPAVMVVFALALAGLFITGRATRRFPASW